MKPGRKLDALIAEKIMGLSVYKGRKYTVTDHSTDASGELNEDDLDNYSTNITAAWEVVEEMMANNYPFFVASNNYSHGRIKVSFSSECSLSGNPLTTPHAICLAALKAEGVEIAD